MRISLGSKQTFGAMTTNGVENHPNMIFTSTFFD
jgi:hypothetical protein